MRRTLEAIGTRAPGIDEGAIALAIRARAALVARLEHLPALAKLCRLAARGARRYLVVLARGSVALEDETLSAAGARAARRWSGRHAEWDAAFGSLARAELDRLHEALTMQPGRAGAIDAFCGERFAARRSPPLPLRPSSTTMLEFLVARGAAAPAARAQRGGEPPVAQAGIAAGTAAPAAAAGPIAPQDALKRLREIGEYFKRQRAPQPLSLLIARAVRWGDMTFEELVVTSRARGSQADLGNPRGWRR